MLRLSRAWWLTLVCLAIWYGGARVVMSGALNPPHDGVGVLPWWVVALGYPLFFIEVGGLPLSFLLLIVATTRQVILIGRWRRVRRRMRDTDEAAPTVAQP